MGSTYANALHQKIISDPKKFKPAKWWSFRVVKEILCQHLILLQNNSSGLQTASTLGAANLNEKTKYDQERLEKIEEQKRRKAELEAEKLEDRDSKKRLVQASEKMATAVQTLINNETGGGAANIVQDVDVLKTDMISVRTDLAAVKTDMIAVKGGIDRLLELAAMKN